jgi:4-amino-4-deoxy-L-arabinose transferase-like glycosyltransferase
MYSRSGAVGLIHEGAITDRELNASGDTAAATGLAQRRMGIGPALLGIALLTGLGLRLAPILAADFPLRDGGLFVSMARDIRHAGFGLPEFSTFNAGNVPFAYPPLGLYILALIPGDPITTERWLPLVWSMLAIPGIYLLAREMSDEWHAGITTLLFAAMPVTWAIEGGGVTRALALVLLLLALWRMAVLVRAPGLRNAVLVGALAGAGILTHPAVGFTALASGALLLAFSPSWRGLAFSALAAAVAAVMISPWLIMVVVRYGAGAVVAAGGSHHLDETLGRFLTLGPSSIGTLDFVLPLALIGAAFLVHRREWLLPAWVVLLVAVPGGEGRYAAIPWAMLASVGALFVADAARAVGTVKVAAGIGFAWLFVASLLAGYQQFSAIPPGVRAAMAQAGADTAPGTRFAVVTEVASLGAPILDWFPTLSGRVSVGTYMGLEWTTVQRWDAAVALDDRIQQGEIPASADFVFTVREGSTSITSAR